jgi:hypothetical protein
LLVPDVELLPLDGVELLMLPEVEPLVPLVSLELEPLGVVLEPLLGVELLELLLGEVLLEPLLGAVLPVPLGVELLEPLGVALLEPLLGAELLDPPGVVLLEPGVVPAAVPVSLPPAVPAPLVLGVVVALELLDVPAPPGAVLPALELGEELGAAEGVLAVPDVSPPPAAGVSFLPHPPNASAAIIVPSKTEYFIFIWIPSQKIHL